MPKIATPLNPIAIAVDRFFGSIPPKAIISVLFFRFLKKVFNSLKSNLPGYPGLEILLKIGLKNR